MERTLREGKHRTGLWAVFRLEQSRYCLCGEAVASIVIPERLTALPKMPENLAGFLKHSNSMVPVIDMRILFGIPSMEQCVAEFAQMKQKHTEWVEELRKSVQAKTVFYKPVDPHKCSFGIWYDSFVTDDYSLNYVLKKLEKPHERIHHCGARANELLVQGKTADEPLEEADRICRQEMLPLLDRLIDAYRDANRGIIIVIDWSGHTVGLLVDEAMGLLEKSKTRSYKLPYENPYIESAVEDKKGILLYLNIENLMNHLKKQYQ